MCPGHLPPCAVTLLLRDLLGGTTDPAGTGLIVVYPEGDAFVIGVWLLDCPPYDWPWPPPDPFPDSHLCPILAANPGTYGILIIDAEGDVYTDLDIDAVADPDELFWDCPPYGSP